MTGTDRTHDGRPEARHPDAWRVAAWCRAAQGWRRRGLAMLAGASATAALPPVHALPLLLPAFCILVWMLEGQRRWPAALTLGLWFGIGHHVAGLYWLAWPMTLDLARFGWMIPFAVFGTSFLLAWFVAAATLAAHLSRRQGWARVVVFATAWMAFEWLRGNILTGFPWNLLGTAWVAVDPMVQTASIWGAYGLSFLTVLIAALPAVAAYTGIPRSRRLGVCLAAAGLFAAMLGYGLIRLSGPTPGVVDGVRLRLVQGHIPQALKWDRTARERFFDLYLRLSRGPGFERVTHVIWPETAVHYRFQTAARSVFLSGARLQRLYDATPARGALIAGTIRDNGREAWNSIQAVTRTGGIVATYDKHHLVPFGEYVPLRGLLSALGVERLAHGRFDFAFGLGPRTIRVPGLPPVSPLICYEAIFPDEATPPRGAAGGSKDRPAWLLNVTNDAWFGVTSGPYQHLAAARLRAVEQGLPLVRVANTGISVVTDARGRILARLGLGRRGVLDSQLPKALPAPPTYAVYGDWVVLLLTIAGLLVSTIPIGKRD